MQLAEYVEAGFHLPQWWSLMSIFGVNNYCDSLYVTKMVWGEFTKLRNIYSKQSTDITFYLHCYVGKK